jgi:mannose-6-phosphate isomerase-like protein (cupin superfamily)
VDDSTISFSEGDGLRKMLTMWASIIKIYFAEEKKMMKKCTFINADMLEPYVFEIPGGVYSSKMLMGEDIVGEPAIHLNQGVLEPHTRMSGDHHEDAEVYYVIDCQEGAEVVTGTNKDGDEEVHYKVKAGDVLYIPGGVHHWIDNRKCDRPFIIITIWLKQEQNCTYFARKKDWGTSIKFKSE